MSHISTISESIAQSTSLLKGVRASVDERYAKNVSEMATEKAATLAAEIVALKIEYDRIACIETQFATDVAAAEAKAIIKENENQKECIKIQNAIDAIDVATRKLDDARNAIDSKQTIAVALSNASIFEEAAIIAVRDAAEIAANFVTTIVNEHETVVAETVVAETVVAETVVAETVVA